MKKFIRGTFGRLLSMTLMVLFLLPSLIIPLAISGEAAVGGRINILFMPLEMAIPDAPQKLSARILQEMQIALAQREGVQVTELQINSPIMKRALESVGENNKQTLLDKFRDAADPKLAPDARKNAAGELVRVLGVDAIVYGTINNYEFTTGPDKNQTYIKVTAAKVTLADDGTAEVKPMEAIGSSWVRPDGKGEQATHDLEAIQAVAQDLATQLSGRTNLKQPPPRPNILDVIGSGNKTPDRAGKPGGKSSSKSMLLLSVLGLAAIAAIAGGGGSDDGGGVTPPPPADAGFAYADNNGKIRLEFPKPANWDSITNFQIWRNMLGEARGGGAISRAKTRSTRSFTLIATMDRDQANVQGDKVILYDDNPAFGYVYAYRVVVISTDRATTDMTMYNGHAPLMQLTAVGPYVPPPVERVISPSHTAGKALLYWSMPGEAFGQPPAATYQMPSFVSGFVIQIEEPGGWTTMVSGIGNSVRQYEVAIPLANENVRFTVRAVSSQSGLMFPLDALTPAQYNQVVAVVNSDTAYTPPTPASLNVTPVVSGANPDKINMQLAWPAPSDSQVTGYKIYRRTTVAAPNTSGRMLPIPTRNRTLSRGSRLIGDQQLIFTVAGRTTTTWTDTTLTAVDYEKSFIYSVSAIAVGGSESAQRDGQAVIAPVTPPAPNIMVIPNPNNPQLTAFQLQWSLPADAAIYGYVIYRAETSLLSSRGPSGITGPTKVPRVMNGRGPRGRGGVGDQRAGSVRLLTDELARTSQRSRITYTDVNLVNGVNYTYAISYLYLGGIESNQSPEVSSEYNVLPGDVTNLTLTEPEAGTRHLSWTAPTTNVDGSPLTDGQAFRVYRSTTLARLPGTNPTIDRATLQSSFTLLYTTPDWITTEYSDTTVVPMRQNVSYVVVSLDLVNQESPGLYAVKQLIKLPDPDRIELIPSSITAPTAGAAQLLTATVYGTDNLPLPYTAFDAVISPVEAGLLGIDAQALVRSVSLALTTDANGVATFYWFPPDPENAVEIGQITATVTGTQLSDVTTLTIQLAPPEGYRTITGVTAVIAEGASQRIYYSADPDDQLGPGTTTDTLLTITCTSTVSGGQPIPAAFSRVRLIATHLGGFRLARANETIIQLGDQVVSGDKKMITGKLNVDGVMQVYFTGQPDDNITKSIDIPTENQVGEPDITAQDAYASVDIDVDDSNLPLLIGPPYRIALSFTPYPHPGWPAQNDQYPVAFQGDTNEVVATVTDIRGRELLAGMPVYFTQTWRKFKGDTPGYNVPLTGPYDYLGCLGYANVSGDVAGGPVGYTDNNGVVKAGFQSNHSGLYTVRAFALINKHQNGMSIMEGYNQDTTGIDIGGETYCGMTPEVKDTSNLLPYLLWTDPNNSVNAAKPTTMVTNSIGIINKTLVGSTEDNGRLHWQVLDVSRGGEVARPENIKTDSPVNGDFSKDPLAKPKIVIDYGGDTAARIHLRATDEDWKYVLPGVPFAVASRKQDYNTYNGNLDEYWNGVLQRVGAAPDEDINGWIGVPPHRESTILGFTQNSEAYILSRGEKEMRTAIPPFSPPFSMLQASGQIPGPVSLTFHNLRQTRPVSVYPYYLLQHKGPSLAEPQVVENPPFDLVVRMFEPEDLGGREHLSTPVRLADINASGNPDLPKSVDIEIELKDVNNNVYPNYTVEIWGYGMLLPVFLKTDAEGRAVFTYTAPDLNFHRTGLDIVDTGRSSFNPNDPRFDMRNLRITIYGNKDEPSRGDWYMQYVTVERPHFLYLQGAPDDGMVLPLNSSFSMMGYAETNMIDDPADPFDGPQPVLDGFNLTFGIDNPAGDGSGSAFNPENGETYNGTVPTSYNTGGAAGQADIYVFYDKNENGTWEPGEPRSESRSYYLGLITPENLTAVYNDVTGQIELVWDEVPGVQSYEIQVSTNDGPMVNLAQTTTNSYTFSPPIGTAVKLAFQVRAVAGTISSEWSAISNAVTYTLALGNPANLVAYYNSATGQVELSWDRAFGAMRYQVYLDPDGLAGPQPFSATPLNPATPQLTTESYAYTPPAGAHTYAYRVRAWNVAYSGYATTADDLTFDLSLAAPENFNAGYSAGTVTLQWDAVPGALKYRLEGNTDGAGWQVLNSNLLDTSYSYTPPSGSHTINYQVRAENGAAFSDYSLPFELTYTLSLLPPASFNAQFNNFTNEVDFNWTAATGATGYKILWRRVGSITFQDYTTTPATPTMWSGDPPTSGTTLEFVAVTLNGTDESDWSAPVFVSIPFLP